MLDAETIARFKKVFLQERAEILNRSQGDREDFYFNEDEKYDEVDQATLDTEQMTRMQLRSRDVHYIRKIEESLRRIEEGVFGECESCGEQIELRRLEVRPTAALCVACKEEEERRFGHRVMS